MKHWYCIILALLVLAGCSREGEGPTASDVLYGRYAERTELAVAQVKGFELGDSARVDVVILVADDSAAWAGLKDEMDIRATEGVTSWLGAIDDPARRVKRSQTPLWRAMAVHEERTVAFYRVESAAQFDALREYQMNNMIDTDNI